MDSAPLLRAGSENDSSSCCDDDSEGAENVPDNKLQLADLNPKASRRSGPPVKPAPGVPRRTSGRRTRNSDALSDYDGMRAAVLTAL